MPGRRPPPSPVEDGTSRDGARGYWAAAEGVEGAEVGEDGPRLLEHLVWGGGGGAGQV